MPDNTCVWCKKEKGEKRLGNGLASSPLCDRCFNELKPILSVLSAPYRHVYYLPQRRNYIEAS